MKLMSEAKKPDRHSHKGYLIRLHPALRQQLEKLVERNASKIATEISIAVRERLAREGLWPPPAESDQAAPSN